MMKVYTYSEARQQLSAVLNDAQIDGKVRVTHRDGRVFIIQPERSRASFLNVKGVDLNMSKDELLAFIHEGRRA